MSKTKISTTELLGAVGALTGGIFGFFAPGIFYDFVRKFESGKSKMLGEAYNWADSIINLIGFLSFFFPAIFLIYLIFMSLFSLIGYFIFSKTYSFGSLIYLKAKPRT